MRYSKKRSKSCDSRDPDRVRHGTDRGLPMSNLSVHSNVQDETIDHANSEFADFAALLAQTHGDGAHQTAHDAIDVTDHAATLAAQHAHHFLV